ncbi:MAG: hypothetical protein WB511_10165 [Nitrososphaeraceae archaeon]
MLKQREPINGKSVIPIYRNSTYSSSATMTIPIRIAQKYELYNSDVIFEERGVGGLFIKKGHSPAKTHTFMSGKKSSCGLLIPSYLARKYDYGYSTSQPC